MVAGPAQKPGTPDAPPRANTISRRTRSSASAHWRSGEGDQAWTRDARAVAEGSAAAYALSRRIARSRRRGASSRVLGRQITVISAGPSTADSERHPRSRWRPAPSVRGAPRCGRGCDQGHRCPVARRQPNHSDAHTALRRVPSRAALLDAAVGRRRERYMSAEQIRKFALVLEIGLHLPAMPSVTHARAQAFKRGLELDSEAGKRAMAARRDDLLSKLGGWKRTLRCAARMLQRSVSLRRPVG